MPKTDIMSVLRQMGYNPVYDADGDVKLVYQLKDLFFFQSEKENFVDVILFNIAEVEEGQEQLHLLTCNMIARKIRVAKTFVDPARSVINASCEFYYTNAKSLKMNIEKTLQILGIIRTTYSRFLRQLSD